MGTMNCGSTQSTELEVDGMKEALLKVKGISKSFPGVKALSNVELTVGYGEVHALLGENGAGKSTLLKILSGAQSSDSGSIIFDGQSCEFATPSEARNSGIVTIYQEFNLIAPLTIAENIFSGREPTKGPFVDRATMHRETRRVLDLIGLPLDPRKLVRDLSVAEQQMVEIARALSIESKLIIMDEPTSALSEHEVALLFKIVSNIRESGVSVIFVTHRLGEVIEACERFTVLRDGQFVTSGDVADIDESGLVRLMVGRNVERLFRKRERSTEADEAPKAALKATGMENIVHILDHNTTRLKNVSIDVNYGEILGVAGLVGAGRTELARMIFGADERAAGSIWVDGQEVDIRSPRDAIAAGIGLVPEDRKLQGCFLDLPISRNMCVVALKAISNRLGFVIGAQEKALIENYQNKFSIRMTGPGQKIGNLSGGNQQKVIVARWLAADPKILIIDEPTRGIDIGAKAQVHEILFELANAGMAIIAISSELPELLTLSDRIMTMCEGRRTAMIDAADANEEVLMRHMAGLPSNDMLQEKSQIMRTS